MRPPVFPQELLNDVAAFDQGLDTRGLRNNPLIVTANRKRAGRGSVVGREGGREGEWGGGGEFNGFSSGRTVRERNKERQ